MATPLTVTIPPLLANQRIEDWEPLFRASTGTMDPKIAIQLLPAHVNRREYERTIVLEAIKEETLNGAFQLLRENLDSPVDKFESTRKYYEMVWACGDYVEDFLGRMVKEARRAGHTIRQACINMVTQLPREVQPACKKWLSEAEEEISDKDARVFNVKIRGLLVEKGIPLDCGWRHIESVKVALLEARNEDKSQPSESDSEPTLEVQAVGFRERKQSTQAWRRDLECFTCGRKGHGWRQCRERSCNYCGQKGHSGSSCPKTADTRGTGTKYTQRGYKNKVLLVDNQYVPEKPGKAVDAEDSVTIRVKVAGKVVAAVFDTGAKPSVMDRKTLGELGLENQVIPAKTKVFGLCQNPVQVIGRVKIDVNTGQSKVVTANFHVLDSQHPTVLLGREFMAHFDQVTFDFGRGRIRLGEAWIPIESTIKGGTPLFRAQTAIREVTVAAVEDGYKTFDVNPKLSPQERVELDELLQENCDLFAVNPKKPGWTTLCEHSIETGDATPIKDRPRRMPPKWEMEVERQLDEMLTNGVCRPSHSPWAASVVLVEKKDGSLRFAIDYRKLNSVTKKDAYSLPNIQTILDKLRGSRYFSFIDIASAYWSVPLKKGDIEKTAFHTPRGQYEMVVMPFGLCNSQATFQRLMDNILDKIPRAESYVDDCCVFSGSFEEHVKDLRSTLARIREGKVKLRRDKCHFGYSGGEFLGHYVSSEGMKPTQGATEKLGQFPVPRSVKELQRFIGSLNYYRGYIPNLARIAQPLYALTQKGARWDWSEGCQNAFANLRKKLTDEPVCLAFPAWDKGIYIEADASAEGVAAVLSQRDDRTDQLRPISFFSSALSSAQKNYSAGQLEAWALVAATRKWGLYLKSAPEVTLITDHNPLQWLRKQKDPRHTFARWLMELEEIPYNIQYRPGAQNSLPDYLSRKPDLKVDKGTSNEDGFEEKIYHVNCPTDRLREIMVAQRDDSGIQNAVKQLLEANVVSGGMFKRVSPHLRVQDGILYFESRVVVPKSLQRDILQRVHAEMHFGYARTRQLLRRSYFWIGLARDTKAHCRSCIVCQKAKPSRKPKEPLQLVDYGVTQPGEAIAMDIGTLPWADGDHRYFLLIVDLFSHHVEIMALKDQTARSVVTAFLEGWVYRGHGVPAVMITDQGRNVDGSAVQELCQDLGIQKRHTTPYHPDSDGMAERHIGFVKQVMRCLLLERNLEKGSWPSLLPEVSFYCNNLDNSSSKISPHLLTFGRQPRAPIDMLISSNETGTNSTDFEYLEILLEKKEALIEVARNNQADSRLVAKNWYDTDKRVSNINTGDLIMLKKEQRKDALDVKFEGPFEVRERRGVIVQIAMGSGKKWVHLNRCKEYERGPGVCIHPERAEDQRAEEVNPEFGYPTEDQLTGGPDSEGERSEDLAHSEDERAARRYPTRQRTPRIYKDLVPWDQVPRDWWRGPPAKKPSS